MDFNFDNFMENSKRKMDEGVRVVADKTNEALIWGIENPEKVVAGVIALSGAVKACQSLIVSHRINKERRRIDHTYYDPSSGFHWELKRAATNNDRIIIMQRKKEGVDIVDILKDLKLI